MADIKWTKEILRGTTYHFLYIDGVRKASIFEGSRESRGRKRSSLGKRIKQYHAQGAIFFETFPTLKAAKTRCELSHGISKEAK